MDPASAAVASVGFAASLATLVAVVVDSTKTLYNLQSQLRNAPENAQRLYRQLQFLEQLLRQIEAKSASLEAQNVPQELQEIWKSIVGELERDMNNFRNGASKLLQQLNVPSLSTKMVRLRIKTFLREDSVEKLAHRITLQHEALKLVLLLIDDQKLDGLAYRSRRLEDLTTAGTQSICSQLQQNHQSQQQAVTLCSSQVQALHKQLEIGLFQARIVDSQQVESRARRRKRGPRTFMAAPVYWHLVHHSLPFGRLDIGVLQEEADDVSDEASDGGSWATRIVVTFIPPRWLSNNMLEYILEARGRSNTALPSLGINMNPTSVNHNPLLRRALDENDLAGLRGVMSDRLSRPNDHVIDSWGRSVSLLDYVVLYGSHKMTCFNFLFEAGATLSNHGTKELCRSMGWRKKENPQVFHAREFLNYFSTRGGTVVGGEEPLWAIGNTNLTKLVSCAEDAYGFQYLQDCVLSQSEPWSVEELAPIDIWLIGILAYTDVSFRKRLDTYLNAYHTNDTGTSVSRGMTTHCYFGIDTVIAQVQNADQKARFNFFVMLATAGTPSMLQPFITAGMDINEGGLKASFLGAAAQRGNRDTARLLMEAGACATSALPTIIMLGGPREDTELEYFLATLSKRSVAPTLGVGYHDPLFNVLISPRVKKVCPRAFKNLWENQVFSGEMLYGSKTLSAQMSYMYQAITSTWHQAIYHFLAHGIPPNAQIGNLFASNPALGQHTWLTLAVECGNAPCVEMMIQFGADITLADGSGRTALQISRSNAAAEHPRKLDEDVLYLESGVDAAQDNEVLEILEKALKTPSMAEATRSRSLETTAEPVKPRFPVAGQTSRQLDAFIPIQAFKRLPQRFWRKLQTFSHSAFRDALLIRLAFVLSYFTVFVLETASIIMWMRTLPHPPKSSFWIVLVLIFALAWGTQ